MELISKLFLFDSYKGEKLLERRADQGERKCVVATYRRRHLFEQSDGWSEER